MVKEYTVYILKSYKTGRYYIGQTSDVPSRLERHNQGRNKSTKNGQPWKLVYTENCTSRGEAFKREKQIKSYKGGEAFKKLIR